MDRPTPSIDDRYTEILDLGTVFGVSDRAETLVARYRADLETTLADLSLLERAPRVFVHDGAEETPFTAGRYTIPTALIERAGGVNIMDDVEKSWTTVAWEAVVARDPEVIVIVN